MSIYFKLFVIFASLVIFVEAIAALVFTYFLGGWLFLFLLTTYSVLVFVISGFISDKYYIKASAAELKLFLSQQERSRILHLQIVEYLVLFPVKCLLAYYIYENFTLGEYFLFAYILFQLASIKSWQERNAREMNIVINEIRNKN